MNWLSEIMNKDIVSDNGGSICILNPDAIGLAYLLVFCGRGSVAAAVARDDNSLTSSPNKYAGGLG